MGESLTAGVAALVLTVASAPAARRLLHRSGRIDMPTDRSLHTNPVPRGGGLACGLGVASGAGVAAALGAPVPWPALAAVFALALVGFIDDLVHLPAYPRLIAQVLAGAALGASIGGPALALVGAVVMPVIVNAVNFMDGINGITALTLASWGVVGVLVGYDAGLTALVTIGAITTGAAVGFLPWNAPRARLFLGDVGSYLFGGLAAVGILIGAAAGKTLPYLVAPLSVYLLDVSYTLVRRAFRRESLLIAHRHHIYQRLVCEAKLPHIAVAVWATSLALTITVVWVSIDLVVAVPVIALLLGLYLASVPLARKLVPRARQLVAPRAVTL